jgi:hypothetical protein
MKSNQLPLDCEATAIRHRDTIIHADLKAESSRTAETLDHTKELSHDFPSIKEQPEGSSLPPIQNLPPELFSEIFLHYASNFEQGGTQCPPFPLIHVCRLWRDAGLSTHHLWNTVPAINLDSSRSRDKEYNDFLRLYLRWSGDVPLSITLLNITSIFSMHPALDAVISHSHRWCDVVIVVITTCFHTLSAIRGCLPTMRSLKLTIHRRMTQALVETLPPPDIFEIAPKLHAVEVQSDLSQDWLKLPWPQLTQYSGILSDPPKFLGACPQLSVCKLRAAYMEEHHFNSQTAPARLGNLQSLSLSTGYRSVSWRHTTQLFEGLVVPNLECFRLRGPEPLICDLLITFMTRSACFLRSLTLHKVGFMEGELTRLLTLTPLLEELDLKPIPPYCTFDFLIFAPTEPPLVPNLRLLTVHHYSGVDSALLKAIRSRCDYPPPCGAQKAYTISRLECARLVFNSKYRPTPDYLPGQNHPKSGKFLGWRNHLNNKFFGNQPRANSKVLLT